MSEQLIELKGSSFTLSVLHLGTDSLPEIRETLLQKVAQAPQFFRRAPLAVNVSRIGDSIDFPGLREVLQTLDFVPVGVTGCQSRAQKEAAQAAGLAVMSSVDSAPTASAAPPPPVTAPTEQPVPVAATRFHDGPVRSGQQIYAKGANLVVTGLVSNGAEVIADGSIHVYGPLRGRALAGAQGDVGSRIYCSDLQAELVAIAGNYQLSEALQQQYMRQSVCISLDSEQQLVISQLK